VASPLDQLLVQADPAGCHVTQLPRTIWVYGGGCEPDSTQKPSSLRDSFWRRCFALVRPPHWVAALSRPEDYPEWLQFSGYNDLAEFERDASYLSRAILLFAESPGALAELGSLSIDPILVARLSVVVQDKYTTQTARRSYLTLGPLRRVGDGVLTVESLPENELLDHDFELILDSFGKRLPKLNDKVKFRPSDPTHILLLVADLVDLLLVSSTSELQRAVSFFGAELDESALLKMLELLDFFGYVLKKNSSNVPFWLRRDSSDAPWVDYTSNPRAERFDRVRFKIKALEYVSTNARLKALYGRAQA
jgi:hypothetical protein